MSYKYKVSICAIFQNEAKFLKEWVEFHLLVGFDHFYLINDQSTDNYEEILKPYISRGVVELQHSSVTLCQDLGRHLTKQVGEYNRLLPKIKNESEWVITLDLDEFMFCPDGRNIRDFVLDYQDDMIGAIYIFWQVYGTSKIAEIPSNQLLVEALTWKAEEQYEYNKYGKSVIKTAECVQLGVHVHRTTPETIHVTPDGKPLIIYADSKSVFTKYIVDISKVRINHYWTGDEKYWTDVKLPRLQKKSGHLVPAGVYRLPYLNKVEDKTIHQYIPRLKPIMKN